MEDNTIEIPERMAALAVKFNTCRPIFIALGDENRQHIIIALLEHHGGMRVGEIAAYTNLSRPAVSHHLKILKDTGIIAMRKEGTKHFYYVDANEHQWGRIAELILHINNLVLEVSEKNKKGITCYEIDD